MRKLLDGNPGKLKTVFILPELQTPSTDFNPTVSDVPYWVISSRKMKSRFRLMVPVVLLDMAVKESPKYYGPTVVDTPHCIE